MGEARLLAARRFGYGVWRPRGCVSGGWRPRQAPGLQSGGSCLASRGGGDASPFLPSGHSSPSGSAALPALSGCGGATSRGRQIRLLTPWWPWLRQLGGCVRWWPLCGDGVVAVQGFAGQRRCGSASAGCGLRVGVHRVCSKCKLCPAMAGRRWRRLWASFLFLKAPSWSSSTRSTLGSRSSGESLDPSGSGNAVVSAAFPSLGRCFEDR